MSKITTPKKWGSQHRIEIKIYILSPPSGALYTYQPPPSRDGGK